VKSTNELVKMVLEVLAPLAEVSRKTIASRSGRYDKLALPKAPHGTDVFAPLHALDAARDLYDSLYAAQVLSDPARVESGNVSVARFRSSFGGTLREGLELDVCFRVRDTASVRAMLMVFVEYGWMSADQLPR